MSPDVGAKVIDEARKHIGAHYINGAYGARPGNLDGCPCRPGGVSIIASHDRLDPTQNMTREKNLTVHAATMTVKKFCVCAGNYNDTGNGGRVAFPKDQDLLDYLEKLRKIPNPENWPYFFEKYSPRRAYGPGPGGDIGGKLVWGLACEGVRHFDCIGFISFCLWKAGGPVAQHEIKGWRAVPNPMGGKVYDFSESQRPKDLVDGDIIIKADHHIAWVARDGAIIEAQDTDVGVRATGRFSLEKPGTWTHLVRLPTGQLAADPDPGSDSQRRERTILISTG